MTPQPVPTPLTDFQVLTIKEWKENCLSNPDKDIVFADFARNLERALVQAKEELAEQSLELQSTSEAFGLITEERDSLRQQLAVEKLHWIEDDRDLNELIDERNKLKKQLEEANKSIADYEQQTFSIAEAARKFMEDKNGK